VAVAQSGSGQGDEQGNTLDHLGITLQAIDRAARQQLQLDATVQGLVITGIEPGSPANDAGLREGDIVVQAGRESVASVSEFKAQIGQVQAGKTILLKVRRENASIFVALRIPKS